MSLWLGDTTDFRPAGRQLDGDVQGIGGVVVNGLQSVKYIRKLSVGPNTNEVTLGPPQICLSKKHISALNGMTE